MNSQNNTQRHDYLVTGFLGFLILISLGIVINLSAKTPDVHISHSTNECVKVINYGDTNYTCDNLPSKYNHVWVQ